MSKFFHVNTEVVSKRSSLVKVKEDENYSPPDHHRDRQEYTKYFEDYNLSLTQRLLKIGRFGLPLTSIWYWVVK